VTLEYSGEYSEELEYVKAFLALSAWFINVLDSRYLVTTELH